MVTVIDGICDCPDLCKLECCPYYDVSQKATKKHIEGAAYFSAHPWEDKDEHSKQCFTCPYLLWIDKLKYRAKLLRKKQEVTKTLKLLQNLVNAKRFSVENGQIKTWRR